MFGKPRARTFCLCRAAAIRLNLRPFMRILDRYVLRSFLEPFALCFLGFLGILIIFDLNDNLSDFLSGKAGLRLIAIYYAHQIPQFILLCMPVGLLLALLYSLSKMSRSNEIISMLTAGRSVPRLLVPLFIFCAGIAALCCWLNYELAPKAEAARREDMGRIKFGEKEVEKMKFVAGHLAKDRMTDRLWFATLSRPNVNALENVHITQLDGEGRPTTRWYAREAAYDSRTHRWLLNHGRQVAFDTSGNIAGTLKDWSQSSGAGSSRAFDDWAETPFRIASSRMDADKLTVPELREYLASNADFPDSQLAAFRTHLHHRWALPLTCLAVVFIGAPLGIVYSRRAVLASVAASIFIFFVFLFTMFLFLALGKGSHVSPAVAAWTPNAILLVVGLYLLYLRSTNREPFQIFSRKK